MTVNKTEHITEPSFPSVREAGYAEEHVDEFVKESTASYNRLIDAKYESDVLVEELGAKCAELSANNEDLTTKLDETKTLLDETGRLLDESVADAETKGVQIEDLVHVNTELRNNVNELHDEISSLNEANAVLQGVADEVVELRNSKADLKEENDTAQERIDDLSSRITELELEATTRGEYEAAIADYSEDEEDEDLVEVETPNFNSGAELNDYMVDSLVVGEESNQPTTDEAKGIINGIFNDDETPAAERVTTLLNKAYALGEEYIDSAHKERVEILGSARSQADAFILEADSKSATILREAGDVSERIISETTTESARLIAEAVAEAEYVSFSVAVLREERRESLGRLRDFFAISQMRIEEIATLPEYIDEKSANDLEELNSYSPADNNDLVAADDAYHKTESLTSYEDYDSTDDEVTVPVAESDIRDLEVDEGNDEDVDYFGKMTEADSVMREVNEKSGEKESEEVVDDGEGDDEDVDYFDTTVPVYKNNTQVESNETVEGNYEVESQRSYDAPAAATPDENQSSNEEVAPVESYSDPTTAPQQYGSFTEVLNLPVKPEEVEPEDDSTDKKEPKKKKGGFMSILNKKIGK